MTRSLDYDVVGASIAATARAGEVMVSSTVRPLVAGSGLTFEDRGHREFKGVAETWQLYAANRETSGADSRSRSDRRRR
jgi:class 3 adenylate cyclase